MKNSIKKWQVAMIVITLCLLTLSALPTFHQVTQASSSSTTPEWMTSMGLHPIKLGLDLNGGVLFVLHVDTDQAHSEYMQSLLHEVKQLTREARIRGIRFTLTNTDTLNMTLSVVSAETKAFIETLRHHVQGADIKRQSDKQYTIGLDENTLQKMRQDWMTQSVSIMRTRIESLGITEAITQRQGKDNIRIELPGVKDPAQAQRILGTTASLDTYPMAEPGNRQASRVFHDEQGQRITVNYKAVFSGANIKAASSGRDEMGQPLVNLVLDSQGGAKMSAFSKQNIGEPMVTVFSEYRKNQLGETVKSSKVINVATIQTQLGNRFSITNLSSPAEAQELAMLLNAGSLSAPVSIVEKRTITATLGEKNVSNGLAALGLGVGLTLLFMALWYRKLGLIANVSLVTNLLCLIGFMAWLPGLVLTLPGIAGFVLTVGMAVDTNVLIFERIKEEKQHGHSNALAINTGYQRAFGTILDANVTTMICALILLAVGYGPVKGFAMTLCLGLITSMFSGVFVARLLTQFFSPQILIKARGKRS